MISWPLDTISAFIQKDKTYAVAVLDIDFFTRICRCFHEEEIQIIMKNIKTFLYSSLPDTAKIWCNSGDEFLIAAQNCSKAALETQMAELKRLFRKQKFAAECSRSYSNIPISFSAGIAAFPDDGREAETIVRKATVALFLAKAYRRNRIVCAPDANAAGHTRKLYDKRLRINVIVGSCGEIGHINRPVKAGLARFWEPQAIDTDASGKVYIADQNNNSILLYDGYTVRRIAGTGSFGYTGDGGSARKAQLNKPTGLTVLGDKLYITDTGNDAVRSVNLKSERISTFAGNGYSGYTGDGGAAEKACLNKPGGIAADRRGNLYINDIANNVIRKVDTDGRISTFAGSGQYGYTGNGKKAKNAAFAEIYGLGISRQSNRLYLADYFNHCIRAINLDTGIITTVAGTGQSGYTGDGGSARKAQLNRPVAVCTDKYDNLYIAESGNHCIRFYEAKTKKLYTLAGDGTAGTGQNGSVQTFRFANPNSVCISGTTLYILDGANNRLCSVFLEFLWRPI